jgi:hypothetical protein
MPKDKIDSSGEISNRDSDSDRYSTRIPSTIPLGPPSLPSEDMRTKIGPVRPPLSEEKTKTDPEQTPSLRKAGPLPPWPSPATQSDISSSTDELIYLSSRVAVAPLPELTQPQPVQQRGKYHQEWENAILKQAQNAMHRQPVEPQGTIIPGANTVTGASASPTVIQDRNMNTVSGVSASVIVNTATRFTPFYDARTNHSTSEAPQQTVETVDRPRRR